MMALLLLQVSQHSTFSSRSPCWLYIAGQEGEISDSIDIFGFGMVMGAKRLPNDVNDEGDLGLCPEMVWDGVRAIPGRFRAILGDLDPILTSQN